MHYRSDSTCFPFVSCRLNEIIATTSQSSMRFQFYQANLVNNMVLNHKILYEELGKMYYKSETYYERSGRRKLGKSDMERSKKRMIIV